MPTDRATAPRFPAPTRWWPGRRTPLVAAVGGLAVLASCTMNNLGKPGPGSEAGVALPTTEGRAAVDRADLLVQQGFREQALAELEKAIAVNPRLTTAYLGIGEIHRQEGNYDKAERSFAKAAELEPRNFDAQYKHGLSLHMLNRVTDAVVAYLRALSVRPDDFEANLNVATAYLQLGEPVHALPFAERAVRLKPDSGAGHVNLGAAYAGLDRHNEAVAQYQQAAERMDLTPELLLNLADSLGKAERHAEMTTTLEQLIAIRPTAVAYERLGSAQFKMRKYDEALASFRKSLEVDPNHYPALNGVGVCLLNRYIWSNRTDQVAREEALGALRKSLQIDRKQPKILELVSRYG
jgi:tetratricopeptide (TPR) repeat protein